MSLAEKITRAKTDYDDVYDAGKYAERDAFWKAFTRNGTRTSYTNAFKGWVQECFNPTRDFVPTASASSMFAESNLTDVAGALKRNGVVLDTSKATNVQMLFYWMRQLTAAPTVDTRNAPSLYCIFNHDDLLQSIEKVILKDDGSQDLNMAFGDCKELVEVRFEGVMGTAVSFAQSTKLSHDSLMSILNALKDYKGTGTAITCTLGSKNLAKLTDAEKAIATEKGWSLA
jgi:hypothetical protein